MFTGVLSASAEFGVSRACSAPAEEPRSDARAAGPGLVIEVALLRFPDRALAASPRRDDRARSRHPPVAPSHPIGGDETSEATARCCAGVKWELAIIALAVLAVAAVSRRLVGGPVTGPMAFILIGLLVGPLVADAVAPSGATVRALAEATPAVVLFADASRIKSPAPATTLMT